MSTETDIVSPVITSTDPEVPNGSYTISDASGKSYLVRPSAGLASVRKTRAAVKRGTRGRFGSRRTRYRSTRSYRPVRRRSYYRRSYRY